MSRLDLVGDRENWRCWLCDEPVDREMSSNDPRGPSVDSLITRAQSKSAQSKSARSKSARSKSAQSKSARSKSAKGPLEERLAHRGCNTNKGADAPVAPWPEHLFVVDPAPIITTVDQLSRKGGRAVVARCPTRADGQVAADWLVDRISRLAPDLELDASVEPGGGQFTVVLHARS
jgi:hypothetical protein